LHGKAMGTAELVPFERSIALLRKSMRTLWIASIACAVAFTAASAAAQNQGSPAPTTAPQAADKAEKSDSGEKFTLEGDAALWTVAIRPDKTADFEKVLDKLRQALMMSDDPQQRRQAEGWVVLRLATPLPDGNVAYVHDVRPVVPGTDYSVMRILYEAYPDESRSLYELYRGAFVKNVALASGSVVMDMRAAGVSEPSTSPAAPPSTNPTPAAPPAPPVDPAGR
jgi:hypothetical protein